MCTHKKEKPNRTECNKTKLNESERQAGNKTHKKVASSTQKSTSSRLFRDFEKMGWTEPKTSRN